jgi:hypothetical protein
VERNTITIDVRCLLARLAPGFFAQRLGKEQVKNLLWFVTGKTSNVFYYGD